MKKLRIWLLAISLFGGTAAQAQQQRTCGTMAHEEELQRQDPTHYKKRQFVEQQVQEYIKNNPNSKTANVVVTIPVVVHVVYKTATQNISDAQVLSQIAVLNEDFRKLNADAGNVPGMFQGLAADVEIEFCMAQRDPSGNATTGITRTQTSVTQFNGDEVKFTAQGGKDAWNTSQYLNMWVCNLADPLLGYAQFPGGPAATDGLVMGYKYFGRIGTVSAPFNKGRTTTHEIGHWLNLAHIWGDANCGNDGVADTPTQQSENYGCPSFPHPSCGNTSDMFMNYMDYVDDNCMFMFTQGQKARMLASLNTSRASMLTSLGCVPPSSGGAVDAGVTSVQLPGPTTCTLTFSPVITLKNYGAAPLTSVNIGFNIDSGMPAIINWTGNLAPQASTTVTLAQVTVTAGPHTFAVATSQPNNTTDTNFSNDSKTVNFVANNNGAALSLPLSEGFEGSFTPAGWQIENADNDMTWEATSLAAKTGTKSVRMNNFDYDAPGQADFLVMPPVDLTSMASPSLSFDLAYKLYTNPTATPNYSDTLQVWVSIDCGNTWYIIYDKSGTALTTSLPSFTTANYVPAANDWRHEVIDLSPIANSNYAVFAFRNATGYENNLYLDNINLNGVNAASEQLNLEDAVSLYPNPTNGIFEITVNAQAEGALQVTVYDQLGRLVKTATQETAGQHSLRMDLRNLPDGVYIAKIRVGNSMAVRRVVLSR